MKRSEIGESIFFMGLLPIGSSVGWQSGHVSSNKVWVTESEEAVGGSGVDHISVYKVKVFLHWTTQDNQSHRYNY